MRRVAEHLQRDIWFCESSAPPLMMDKSVRFPLCDSDILGNFLLCFFYSAFNLSRHCHLFCLPFGSQRTLSRVVISGQAWHTYFKQKGTGVSPSKDVHASKVACGSRHFLSIPIPAMSLLSSRLHSHLLYWCLCH